MRQTVNNRRFLAESSRAPDGLYRARLAEDYDGIGQFVLVSLSGGALGGAYKARIAAGDFGGGRTFPIGTPVVVSSRRGQVDVLTLGNIPSGCFDDFERSDNGPGWTYGNWAREHFFRIVSGSWGTSEFAGSPSWQVVSGNSGIFSTTWSSFNHEAHITAWDGTGGSPKISVAPTGFGAPFDIVANMKMTGVNPHRGQGVMGLRSSDGSVWVEVLVEQSESGYVQVTVRDSSGQSSTNEAPDWYAPIDSGLGGEFSFADGSLFHLRLRVDGSSAKGKAVSGFGEWEPDWASSITLGISASQLTQLYFAVYSGGDVTPSNTAGITVTSISIVEGLGDLATEWGQGRLGKWRPPSIPDSANPYIYLEDGKGVIFFPATTAEGAPDYGRYIHFNDPSMAIALVDENDPASIVELPIAIEMDFKIVAFQPFFGSNLEYNVIMYLTYLWGMNSVGFNDWVSVNISTYWNTDRSLLALDSDWNAGSGAFSANWDLRAVPDLFTYDRFNGEDLTMRLEVKPDGVYGAVWKRDSSPMTPVRLIEFLSGSPRLRHFAIELLETGKLEVEEVRVEGLSACKMLRSNVDVERITQVDDWWTFAGG